MYERFAIIRVLGIYFNSENWAEKNGETPDKVGVFFFSYLTNNVVI